MREQVPDPSDATLAERISNSAPGDARDLEAELYRRFAPRARLFAFRLLRDDQAARDLAQQALMLTIEKLRARKVDSPERIGTFILGVCRMLAANQRRRATRQQALGVLHPASPDAAEPELARAEGSTLARLAGCLERLSERARTVTVLTFYAEQSSEDIARQLRLTPGNVRVIRHRALSALQDCMGAGS